MARHLSKPQRPANFFLLPWPLCCRTPCVTYRSLAAFECTAENLRLQASDETSALKTLQPDVRFVKIMPMKKDVLAQVGAGVYVFACELLASVCAVHVQSLVPLRSCTRAVCVCSVARHHGLEREICTSL